MLVVLRTRRRATGGEDCLGYDSLVTRVVCGTPPTVSQSVSQKSFTMNDIYSKPCGRSVVLDGVAPELESPSCSESIRAVTRFQKLSFKGMSLPKKRLCLYW